MAKEEPQYNFTEELDFILETRKGWGPLAGKYQDNLTFTKQHGILYY